MFLLASQHWKFKMDCQDYVASKHHIIYDMVLARNEKLSPLHDNWESMIVYFISCLLMSF